jgi:glycopeptide antibiotics resistance protein
LRTRRRYTFGQLVAVGGFATYLLLVSSYTVFPLWLESSYIEDFRRQGKFLNFMNFVPFRDLSLKYLMSIQGWGNVVLGIPFGFVFPFVVTVSGWRQMVRYGLMFGAAIELTQLAISLLYGFAYRVIDVNDFLLNFTGVLSGYAALLLVAYAYQGVSDLGVRKDKVRSARFWGHFEAVLLNTAGLISSRNELQPSGQSPRRSGRVGPLRR